LRREAEATSLRVSPAIPPSRAAEHEIQAASKEAMTQAPLNRRHEGGTANRLGSGGPDRRRQLRVLQSDDVRARIGERLKAMYDAVLAEPVPECLRKVLEQLAAQENRR